MTPPIDLKLLGAMSVRARGESLALPSSRKTRALLAYLVVQARAERRTRLCELFWQIPDDPKGSLRWSLSKLRRLVDEPEQKRLLADRETVRIELPADAVDWIRLRDLVQRGPATARTESLRAAVDDAGDFLEGLELSGCDAFNAWCIAQRETARRWRVAVLDELTTRELDAEEAVDLARSWTMLDPYEARAWERLVSLLELGDRPSEAEQQRSLAVRVLGEAKVPIPGGLRRSRADRSSARRATAQPADAPETPLALEQNVRFCRSADGARIAYAQVGTGAPLVRTGYWLNSLEHDPGSPVWRPWIEHFARHHTLLRYDARGFGMSDRDADQSVDKYVEDLAAVIDAAGLEQCDLYGMGQGGLAAIGYAAQFPERVRRLVLQSCYAEGWTRRADPQELERRKATITLATSGWRQNNQAMRSMFLGLYLPDGDEAQCRWFDKFLLTMMAHPGTRELHDVLGYADVRHLATQVQAPTLVIHPRGENIIPLAAGREVAALIPAADLLTLDSSSHLVVPGDPVWPALRKAVDDFLS